MTNKIKQSIYRRKRFFYKGALVVKDSQKVNWMSRISGTSKKNHLEATVFKPFCVFVAKVQVMTHQLLTHEVIHTRQIFDCMLIALIFGISMGFPWWACTGLFFLGLPLWWVIYLLDFIILRAFLDHHSAYLLIGYEQEAYFMENKKHYLHLRWFLPGLWIIFMFGNIFLLWNRRYRICILRRLVHIRISRKSYYYWSQKFKKEQTM